MKYNFYLLIIFTLLNPYIGLSIFPSDTQPFAVLFSFVYIVFYFYYKNKIYFPRVVLPFLALLLFSIFSFLIKIFAIKADFIDNLRYLYSYITPVSIILFVYTLKNKLNFVKLTKNSVDIFIFFCFLGFFFNLFDIDIPKYFVNRAKFEDISHGRGLTGFFPEQSRVSEQCSMIFFIYYLVVGVSLRRFFCLFLIANLSFAGQFFIQLFFIFLSFVCAQFILRQRLKSLFIKSFLLLCVSLCSYYLFINLADLLVNLGVPSRGVVAIKIVLTHGLYGWSEDSGIIIKVSGLFSMISAILSVPLNFQLGSFSNPEFIDTISTNYSQVQNFVFNNPNPKIPSRVYSALGLYIVDYGIIGLFAVFYILIFLFNGLRKRKFIIIWSSIFLLFCLFVKLNLANPTLWFLFALIHFKFSFQNFKLLRCQ